MSTTRTVLEAKLLDLESRKTVTPLPPPLKDDPDERAAVGFDDMITVEPAPFVAGGSSGRILLSTSDNRKHKHKSKKRRESRPETDDDDDEIVDDEGGRVVRALSIRIGGKEGTGRAAALTTDSDTTLGADSLAAVPPRAPLRHRARCPHAPLPMQRFRAVTTVQDKLGGQRPRRSAPSAPRAGRRFREWTPSSPLKEPSNDPEVDGLLRSETGGPGLMFRAPALPARRLATFARGVARLTSVGAIGLGGSGLAAALAERRRLNATPSAGCANPDAAFAAYDDAKRRLFDTSTVLQRAASGRRWDKGARDESDGRVCQLPALNTAIGCAPSMPRCPMIGDKNDQFSKADCVGEISDEIGHECSDDRAGSTCAPVPGRQRLSTLAAASDGELCGRFRLLEELRLRTVVVTDSRPPRQIGEDDLCDNDDANDAVLVTVAATLATADANSLRAPSSMTTQSPRGALSSADLACSIRSETQQELRRRNGVGHSLRQQRLSE